MLAGRQAASVEVEDGTAHLPIETLPHFISIVRSHCKSAKRAHELISLRQIFPYQKQGSWGSGVAKSQCPVSRNITVSEPHGTTSHSYAPSRLAFASENGSPLPSLSEVGWGMLACLASNGVRIWTQNPPFLYKSFPVDPTKTFP